MIARIDPMPCVHAAAAVLSGPDKEKTLDKVSMRIQLAGTTIRAIHIALIANTALDSRSPLIVTFRPLKNDGNHIAIIVHSHQI
jgi:hypothetical protein